MTTPTYKIRNEGHITGGDGKPVWIVPSDDFRIGKEAEAALAAWTV